MIEQLLQNLNAKEKANLKSREIAKLDFSEIYTDSKTGIQVEIQNGKINQIEGGIELYARAFKNGKPLGLGSDGTTEWEHFRIFNPPIFVDDPNGTIERRWMTNAENGIFNPEVEKVRKLREDPIEAIRQTLAHTIKVSSKEGTNIVKGSVGNTTSTFFPVAGSASPIDSYVNNADSVWATIHDAITGINAGDSDANIEVISDNGRVGATVEIWRSFIHFDASAIGDTDTIDSATESLWVVTKEDGYNDAQGYIAVVGLTSPANDAALAAADFDQCGAITNPTKMTSDVDITNITTGQYTNITVNATGLSNISKTGLTRWGVREGHDIENVTPTDNGLRSRTSIAAADTAGTANDPKLVVVHSAAAVAGYPPTLLFMNAG